MPENEQSSNQPLRPTRPTARTTSASSEQPASTPAAEKPSSTRQARSPVHGLLSSEQIKTYLRRAREYFNRSPHLQGAVYQKKFAPAFWTVASLVSLVINIILIAVVLILARQLFNLRTIVSEGLVGGLYENFVKMDQAHILTDINVSSTIQVQDEIDVVFDLPLNQNTEVVLTQETRINGATIFLNNTAVPLNIILPTGTALNIGMDMVVPVSTTIPVSLDVPVNLTVPVDIPLEQTQLHEPFVGLRSVVEPYNNILSNTPSSWDQIKACDHWYSRWLCKFVFGGD